MVRTEDCRDAITSTEDTVTGEATPGAHGIYGVHIPEACRYFPTAMEMGEVTSSGSGRVLHGRLGAPGSGRKFSDLMIRLEQTQTRAPEREGILSWQKEIKRSASRPLVVMSRRLVH